MTQQAAYRLDGIYLQRQEGYFMQRVKLAAGTVSSIQARAVADTALRFGRGEIHLTTRGSMEIHWLQEGDLPEVRRMLAMAGLTSRGACGGAVRGVSCSGTGMSRFPFLEETARRIQQHFTANPRFEGLPKKFKIGVEAGTAGRRHLIQDAGLVLTGGSDSAPLFDLYLAGGLGREPQAGFLFEAAVTPQRILPLLEAVIRVYSAHAPAGKRLKHLVWETGENEFRRLVAQEPAASEELPARPGIPGGLTRQEEHSPLLAGVTGGQLSSTRLQDLAAFSDRWSGGVMTVTPDQDISFAVTDTDLLDEAARTLDRAGFPPPPVTFRICPGSHQCRVGLSPTRDIARTLTETMSTAGRSMTWAISGCPNSCTQPQLADIGIITAGMHRDIQGERVPYFDICLGSADGLGRVAAHALPLEELPGAVAQFVAGRSGFSG